MLCLYYAAMGTQAGNKTMTVAYGTQNRHRDQTMYFDKAQLETAVFLMMGSFILSLYAFRSLDRKVFRLRKRPRRVHI